MLAPLAIRVLLRRSNVTLVTHHHSPRPAELKLMSWLTNNQWVVQPFGNRDEDKVAMKLGNENNTCLVAVVPNLGKTSVPVLM